MMPTAARAGGIHDAASDGIPAVPLASCVAGVKLLDLFASVSSSLLWVGKITYPTDFL